MADHRKFEPDYPFLFWLTKVLAGWIPFHLLERSTDRISIGQLIFTDQKYVRLPHTKKPNSVPLYFMGTERVPYNTSVGMEDVAVSDRTMAEMEVSSRLADIFSPKGSIDTTRITDDWLKMLSQTQGNEALANIIAERRNEVVYPENLSTQANTHDIFVELFGENYKEELDINPLQDGDPIANHQITVCIRKRPMSTKELKKKEVDVVTVPQREMITIHEPKSKVDLTKYLDNQHFR